MEISGNLEFPNLWFFGWLKGIFLSFVTHGSFVRAGHSAFTHSVSRLSTLETTRNFLNIPSPLADLRGVRVEVASLSRLTVGLMRRGEIEAMPKEGRRETETRRNEKRAYTLDQHIFT